MSTRWRVTWTDEPRKKRPKIYDGTCTIDSRDRLTLVDDLGAKNAGDGCVVRGVKYALVHDDDEDNAAGVVVRSGARVTAGHVEVYIDERIDGDDAPRAVDVPMVPPKHRFVNHNFRKKFVSPMTSTTNTVAASAARATRMAVVKAPVVVVSSSAASAAGAGAVVRDGQENAPSGGLGEFARFLSAHGGDIDAAAAAALDIIDDRIDDDDVDDDDDDDLVPVVVPTKMMKKTREVKAPRRAMDKPRRAPPPSISTEINVAFPTHDYMGVEVERASSFVSVRAYQSYFITALCENMSARLRGVAKIMHDYSVSVKHSTSGAAPPPDVVAKIMRQRYDTYYFADCELRSGTFRPKGETQSRTMLHLEVKDFKAYKAKARTYSMGDLWIVSTEASFQVNSMMSSVGVDRNRAPWIGVVECLWHGLNKNGTCECRLVSPRPARLRDNATMKVYAIHSFNGRGDMDEARNMLSLSDGVPPPLMDSLLGKPPPMELEEEEELYYNDPDTGVDALRRAFTLNEDQARAVSGALASAKAMSQIPIRLIHGPFGSGKTHTIAAFVIKAVSCLKAKQGRILISANTNVAVDRVLTALLDAGFNDFIRVGSVRKIDPTILPYSLHVKTGKGKSHIKELEAMLNEATSLRSKTILKQEIATLSSGKLGMRKALLKKCSVVGVTCTSSCNEELQGMKFTVTVLDECSQMTETSSLLPIVNSHCQTLVAVGDPNQLPPVLECFAEENGHSKFTRNPLNTPLFTRMSTLGHSKLTLRTQYRLHPALSKVPNACFYDGVLLDGVSASDRKALIKLSNGGELPPILWWDTNGMDQRDGGSRFNVTEADRVTCIVKRLLECGISARQIGVIAPYVAQSQLITNKFTNISTVETEVKRATKDIEVEDADADVEEESFSPSDIQVSTVDAFQGQEKEVIILTLCGSPASNFITDERINVALTRAKRHLIIVGAAMVAQRAGVRAWSDTLKLARTTPNGYVPVGALTNETLHKWNTAIDETDNDVIDVSQSDSQPKASNRSCIIRDALVELQFDQKMYWNLYCAVMRGLTYEHEESRAFFMSSPLIPLIRRMEPKLIAKDCTLAWHQPRVRRILTQEVLPEFRRFIECEYGREWGTLDKLISAFENRDAFLNDPTGFGWLCVQDAGAEADSLAQADDWARTDFVPPKRQSSSASQDSWD